MSALVVDASVVIKWFIPEIHSDAASRLLESDDHYFAPDLLFAETANVVWKKVRLGQLESGQGTRLVRDLEKMAVETIPSRALANEAYALAGAIGRSVYDAMYLALAVRLDTKMITADERLASALARLPLTASHVQMVQDFHG